MIKYNQKFFDVHKVCDHCTTQNIIYKNYSGAYKIACDCSERDIKPIHKEVNQSYNELVKGLN